MGFCCPECNFEFYIEDYLYEGEAIQCPLCDVDLIVYEDDKKFVHQYIAKKQMDK